METVYIETSIISYLTARPPRDVVGAARQQLTIDWWETCRHSYRLHVSSIVDDEASKGDPDAAARRLTRVEGIPRLAVTDGVRAFARTLLGQGALPSKAMDDALHISVAAVHGMDYLLTWNCRHIDNAQTKPLVRFLCVEAGFAFPEICTPEELMGDAYGA